MQGVGLFTCAVQSFFDELFIESRPAVPEEIIMNGQLLVSRPQRIYFYYFHFLFMSREAKKDIPAWIGNLACSTERERIFAAPLLLAGAIRRNGKNPVFNTSRDHRILAEGKHKV